MQLAARLRFQLRQRRIRRRPIRGRAQRRQRAARLLERQRRRQEAQRRSRAARRRNQHLPNAQDARDICRMRRPGATEGDHRIAARVLALLHQVDARSTRHRLAHHRMNARRRLHRRQPQLAAQPRQRRFRRRLVQRHGAAQEEAGVVVAQQQVGVRHGRVQPALPIAGRPRRGARAARPHLQQTRLVQRCYRTTSSADLDHVHHRRLDRQAGAPLEAMHPRRFHHRRHGGAPALDHRALGRGAAHVEGDGVRQPGFPREQHGGQRATGRPTLQQADREGAGHFRRAQPAIALHQPQRAGKALRLQLPQQPADVAVHQRLHEGVGAGCRAALILADLGRHLAAQADGNAREGLPQYPPGRLLMRGVGVAVQEHHGYSGAALRHQARTLGPHRRLVQRLQHAAVIGQPLGDLQPAAARHQRFREFQEQVVDVVALLDAELQHVAEAARRQQPQLRAMPLDQRVRHQRGAVQQFPHLGHADARRRAHRADAFQRAIRRVLRRCQAFVQANGAGRSIQQHEVGEGATDIEAKPIAGGCGIGGHVFPSGKADAGRLASAVPQGG